MRDCPKCGAPVDGLVCDACGEGRIGKGGKPIEPSRGADMAIEARRRFAATAPSSFDLTDQQWYNVCKFFPEVAKRSRRPMFPVSSLHPLDRTASMGPMLGRFRRRMRDPEADAERSAIQAESLHVKR